MSGGESNPPSLRARYGVLGHAKPSLGWRQWNKWHRKMLRTIKAKPKKRKFSWSSHGGR